MTQEELQNLFYRIVCARSIIEYNGRIFIVKDPRPELSFFAQHLYDREYERLIATGIPTESQVLAILREKNLWGESQEKQIEELRENLKKLQEALPLLEFQSNEKKRMVTYIDVTQDRIEQLHARKMSLATNSAEYLAKLYMYKYFLFTLTTDELQRKIWNTWEEFLKEDNNLVNHLVSKSFFDQSITEKTIRKLARSEPWRTTWITAVKTGNLFSESATQMTEIQRTLVGWSIVYDNALEHPEAPGYEVLDNDALFDAWCREQSEKRKKETVSPDSFIKNEKIRNAGEVCIFVDSLEDAERVYKLNDPVAINTLKSREKAVKAQGQVSEQNLPDVKKRLALLKNNMEAAKQRTT